MYASPMPPAALEFSVPMRVFLGVAFAFTIALGFMENPYYAPPPDPPVAAAAPQDDADVPARTPRETTVLRVLSGMGVETTLRIDDSTEVLVVASWCPFTRQLDRALRDPRARPHLRGKRLVYLFRWDEVDRLARRDVREGRLSQSDADAILASLPPGPRLMNPEFAAGVAADQVYFVDDEHPVQHSVFPEAFSGPPNVFAMAYDTWLGTRLGVSSSVRRELLGRAETSPR